MFTLGLAHGFGKECGPFYVYRRARAFERVQDRKDSFSSGVPLNSLLLFENSLLVR
jgi:hypothetical protein